jgi:hypothetical protein
MTKEIGDKESYYNTKISFFSFSLVWHILLAGGSSEPFQGFWAYLRPRGITLGAVAQFLVAWEGRKKRGFFLILSCCHYYMENFQELNLGKVLFLLQPPKIYFLCFVESNTFF